MAEIMLRQRQLCEVPERRNFQHETATNYSHAQASHESETRTREKVHFHRIFLLLPSFTPYLHPTDLFIFFVIFLMMTFSMAEPISFLLSALSSYRIISPAVAFAGDYPSFISFKSFEISIFYSLHFFLLSLSLHAVRVI